MKKSLKKFEANKLSKQVSNKITGGLSVAERAARTGRNPRTNKVVEEEPACC